MCHESESAACGLHCITVTTLAPSESRRSTLQQTRALSTMSSAPISILVSVQHFSRDMRVARGTATGFGRIAPLPLAARFPLARAPNSGHSQRDGAPLAASRPDAVPCTPRLARAAAVSSQRVCCCNVQAPAVAAGFVVAYGFWAVMTRDSDSKLPHTIMDPKWLPATQEMLLAAPRQGSETPAVSVHAAVERLWLPACLCSEVHLDSGCA